MSFESLKETWANPSYYDHAQFGHEIIGELLGYPEKLKEAEKQVMAAKKRVDEIKNKMETKRYSLLASGVIDGKNAEVREAQIALKLGEETGALLSAKENLDEAEFYFKQIEIEYRTLLAISRVLGNEPN